MVISLPGLRAEKRGLEETVNHLNLTLAVLPKYLSDEAKLYIFTNGIPRVVCKILGGIF